MVQLTDTEFAAVARKKVPLIGPESERRVLSKRGRTTTADITELDRLVVGSSVRIEFSLQTPTQLRRDIELAIEALTKARNVLTKLDEKDRSLMAEARRIIKALAFSIGKRRAAGKPDYLKP